MLRRALAAAERQAILGRAAQRAVRRCRQAEAWAILLDEGVYLGSGERQDHHELGNRDDDQYHPAPAGRAAERPCAADGIGSAHPYTELPA